MRAGSSISVVRCCCGDNPLCAWESNVSFCWAFPHGIVSPCLVYSGLEIYDEDDDDDFQFSEDSITLQEDGSFLIRGDAELDDVDTILALQLQEEEGLKEFATVSGFLCMCAGEIPRPGDFIMTRGWCFEVENADDKRILLVRVEHLVGTFDESEETNEDENPLRKMLRLNQNNKQSELNEAEDTVEDIATTENDEGVVVVSDDKTGDETHPTYHQRQPNIVNSSGNSRMDDDAALLDAAVDNVVEEKMTEYIQSNKMEANEVERMVESGERKMELLEAIRREQQEQQQQQQQQQ